MKKGKMVLNVLGAIGKATMSTAAVIEAILASPYGSSSYTIGRKLSEIEKRRASRENELRQKQQFYDLLYRLKRDGLIKKEGEKEDKSISHSWSLTTRGIRQLKALKNYHQSPLQRSYPVDNSADSGELKIIVFDIPEKLRRKRGWLRKTLVGFGFTMLQKSVWVGKVALPHEFIKDLDALSLTPYIEILAITKTGSLKKFPTPSSSRSSH